MKKPSKETLLKAYKILKTAFMCSVVIGMLIAIISFGMFLTDEIRRYSIEKRSEKLRVIKVKTHPFQNSRMVLASKIKDYTLQLKLQFSDNGSIAEFVDGDKLYIQFYDNEGFASYYITIDGKDIYNGNFFSGIGVTNNMFYADASKDYVDKKIYLSSTNIEVFVKRKNPPRLPPGFEPYP